MDGMRQSALTATLTLCLCLLAAILSACSGSGDALQDIQSRGELKVATRNSPTTYFLDRDGPDGFEYALAGMLARDLGVELTVESAFTLEGLFELLNRGEADLAAAGLTLTERRQRLYPHSAPYYKLKPQVVYVAGRKRPEKVEQLLGKHIVVLANSSHAAELQRLQQEELPELQWEEVEAADTMELLEMIDTGQADVAIIDSNEFEVQGGLYPRLKVAFDLIGGEEQDMVWYLAPGVDNSRLQAYLDQFFQRLREDGTLERLRQRYFGHTEGFSRTSSHTFNRQMRSTLPKYREMIEKVANEYQLPWQLLAAIAYQESHWDPQATSPTGVRGLMMLTRPTAREVGVSNRLDPLESLRGGARYLKNLRRRLPKSIKEPDRTWFALAAYNIGLGHLEDARVITQRQGGNPNLWQDVRQRLPLLQKSLHYRKTRYGYARGVEAANYVRNIRRYQTILDWQDISDKRPLPPLQAEDYLPQVLRGTELSAL